MSLGVEWGVSDLLGIALVVVLALVVFPYLTGMLEIVVGLPVARLLRLHLVNITVRPFSIDQGERGWRLRRLRCLPRRWWLRDQTGVLSASVDDRNLERRAVVVAIANPLIVLLLLAATAFLYFQFDYPNDFGGFLAQSSIFVIGWLWIVSLVANLWRGLTIIITLRRGGPVSQGWQAYWLLLGADLVLAQHPREWNAGWIEQAAALTTPYYDFLVALFGYHWALDRGDVNTAQSFLDRALDAPADPPEHRHALLEAAYFTARHRGDHIAARSYLDQVTGCVRYADVRLRARAAVLLAEGRHQEARESAALGLAAMEGTVRCGSNAAESDWLRDLLTLSSVTGSKEDRKNRRSS